MSWLLIPRVGYVNARIEFTPVAALAKASQTVSFIQTVSESLTSGGFAGLGSHTSSRKTEVDKLRNETDPFYGAQWDRSAARWTDEPYSTQISRGEGSRPATATAGSAVINDTPEIDIGEVKRFETVATIIETGVILGALHWRIGRWPAGFFNKSSSTTVENVICVEEASANFSDAIKKFYRTPKENVVLDGFAAGSADLLPTHPQQLASIVENLRENSAKRVLLGGAATADEPQPPALARNRAEKVKAYLMSQSIAESRIDVESYGSDWALTPVTAAGAAQLNRRVQIRLVGR
jgi:outer membrane protein OmpA-like peptidoglycan-associated protein